MPSILNNKISSSLILSFMALIRHRLNPQRRPVWLIHVLTLILILASSRLAVGFEAVISNERSGDLVFLDESGNSLDIIKLCNRPRGMVQDRPKKLLYIACSDDNKVLEFNLQTKKIIREFLGIPGAMAVTLNTKSRRLFITNEGASKATVLDIDTGNLLSTLQTGFEPDGVIVSDDGSRIFVASENAGLIHVFDGNTYSAIQSIITSLRPRRMAIRNTELWISSEMGSRVEIFDLNTLLKIDEIIFAPKGFRSEQMTPVDILFDSTKKLSFVALGAANHVAIINAETRSIEKYILVGRRAWGLGITPDDARLFVLNGLSDDATIIDLKTRRPIKTARTGLAPHSVEVFDR